MDKPIKTHASCPYCGHDGCFTLWEDGGYHCHSCGAKPDKQKKRETSVLKDTNNFTVEPSKSYRSIGAKAVKKYGIKTIKKGEEDYARLYPYPHKDKKRILPKDFSDNAGFTNDHLFGMDKFNAGSSKSIIVVEGEDDAPAAYEILGHTYPVVAIPGASISNSLLKNCHSYLDAFEKIIVATDGDDAGEQAANRLAATFPNKVYRAHLTTCKDAQQYLERGKKDEFKWAVLNADKYVPEYDTSTPSDFIKVLHETKDAEYIPSGIEAYDEEHLGLFQGHVTLFQAPEGTGKTELFHFFEYHLLKNYPDIPFASCHLEESKKRTTLTWASYHLNKNVTRQDLITDQKEVDDSVRKLTENEQAHLFSIGIDEDPIIILDRVKYYANVCGCKYIFIEPIQDLAQQNYSGDTDERFLSKIAVGLARIATEYNVGIVMIAHENDEGLISDCRKLGKQASVIVRLERVIDDPDPDIRNTTKLWSKKNRPSAFVGYGGQLSFNPETFVMKEKFV